MRVLLCAILLALLAAGLSFGQSALSTIQTGFVVVTPVSGNGEGLSVSETFGQNAGAVIFQSSVLPSPLVTLTDVVLNFDPNAGVNTGIAIVNPNDTSAVVTLTLRNQQGTALSTRTIVVGSHQQIPRFASELFQGDPAFAGAFTGLLFINSNVSVGVLGLTFNGPSFTSLPVASQLSLNAITAQGSIVTPVLTPIITTFANTVGSPPVASTFTPVQSTATGFTGTTLIPAITTPLVPAPGQFATAAPVVNNAIAPPVTVFPQMAFGVGGPGALLLPQVAMGGGWTSRITIANTSAVPQTVRVDFFDAFGGPLIVPFGPGISNVVVAPGGVVVLSTGL